MDEKQVLRIQITVRLKAIDPRKCEVAAGIRAAIKHPWNFDNLMHLIKGLIDEDLWAMNRLIGWSTVELIVKYLLFKN